MMTRKILALVAALAAAVPAQALPLGTAKLTPYYGFESRYEDNIYRVPRNENNHAITGGGVRGSWIFSNNLGVKLSIPVGQHKFNAGYDAVAETYKVQPKANNAINQRVDAGWSYEGSKIDAKLTNSYVNTQDPAFNPNGTVLNGDLVSRERRWQNTAAGAVEYGLGDKFFFGVDGDTVRHHYLNQAGGTSSLQSLLDRSETTFGFKTGYKLAPKTKVYIAGHRRLVHYTQGIRQDNHRDFIADLGIEGDLASKLKGKIEAGLEHRKYDRDSANPTRDNYAQIIRVATSLDYRPVEVSKITLALNRGSNEASTGASRFFVSNGVSLGYTHKIGAKSTAGISGGYQQDRFSQDFTQGGLTRTRRDDNYNVGVKADHKFREYLTAGVSYINNTRFSTFSQQFNYRDNITAANFKLSF
jgi:hypothetical protein